MRSTFFKSILRNLWKNRINSVINVLGLTLGLTSCLFLYIYLKYEHTFDTHQPLVDQIYRVNITQEHPNRTIRVGYTESMLGTAMRNEFPDLEAVIQTFGPTSGLVSIHPGTPEERTFEEERNIFFVDSLFLKYMEYDFIAGHPQKALDDQNGIVLSSELVEKYYPDYVGRELDLIGKEVELYEEFRVFITGVIDSPPSNSNFPFQILASDEIYYRRTPWDRNNWSNLAIGMTFAVLAEGQTPESIDARFPTLVEKYRSAEDAETVSYSLLNLKKLHNTSDWGQFAGNYTTSAPMEIGFIAVGIFILLSACINFINLQTAQSINRAKEVGIKKVLGGSRASIVTQLLLETAILTSIAFTLALWMTELVLDGWNDLLSIVNANMQLDWSVFVAGSLLVVFITLVAGLYPALKLSAFRPVEALRARFTMRNTGGALSLRQILVLVQFVISQILIIVTIIISGQMSYFLEKDLGFNKEGILHVTTYMPDSEQIDRLANELSTMPEVSSFSLASGPPLTLMNNYGTSFKEIGHEEKGDIKTENKFVDHRFIPTFDLELVAGRNFRPDEYRDSITVFIVNESLTKQLEVDTPADAVGKRINCYGVNGPIIGVLKDFHVTGLSEEIGPSILFSRKSQVSGAEIKVAAGNMAQLLPKLELLWREVFPSRTFKYQALDDYMLAGYIVEDIMFKSIRAFCIVAIIIGCLGLYGLVSFLAIQKTKEIGVRKVLGASYLQIVSIFSGRFFILVSIAFIIAAPVAYMAMGVWLENYVYRIDLSWWLFALGLLVTMVLTAVTISYVSFKTARINPAETLKFE
ncbi:MAG: FtsX-like permease family protein [Cyclobacteriaceae bacterium]